MSRQRSTHRYAGFRIGKALYRLDLKYTPYRREHVRVGRSIRIATFIFGACVALRPPRDAPHAR